MLSDGDLNIICARSPGNMNTFKGMTMNRQIFINTIFM